MRWIVCLGVSLLAVCPLGAQDFGDGTDGAVTFTSYGQVFPAARTLLTADAASGSSTLTVSSTSGFSASDEVLILVMRDSGGSFPTSDVGTHEFSRIASIGGGALTLATPLTEPFPGSETQVIEVPNYTDVTIDSQLQVPEFAGFASPTGGVVAFRATGTVTINFASTLLGDAKGYLGGAGTAGAGGNQGQSVFSAGAASTSGNLGGGGGGASTGALGGGGGGAGHAGAGANGTAGGAATGGTGGVAVGAATHQRYLMGSGGGAGGGDSTYPGGAGGDGGGLIYIAADTIDIQGNLWNSGDNGFSGGSISFATFQGGGGAGAGGTTVLIANNLDVSGSGTVEARGGFGALGGDSSAGNGGNAGNGRILADVYRTLSVIGVIDPSPTWGFSAVQSGTSPAGDAPPLALGNVRCTVDFADGSNSSTTTVTLNTSDAVNLTPSSDVADVHWEIGTSRTGWTSAVVTFEYLDSEITGLNEADLRIFQSSSRQGPFTELPTAIDEGANTATVTVSGFSYFALALTGSIPVELSVMSAD